MIQTHYSDPTFQSDILGMIQAERQKSVSRREWLHRLKGLGLCVEADTLRSLRTRKLVCTLPAHLYA